MSNWGDLQSIFQLGAAVNLGVAGVVGSIDLHLRRAEDALRNAHNSLDVLKDRVATDSIDDADLKNLMNDAFGLEKGLRDSISDVGNKPARRYKSFINFFLFLSFSCIIGLVVLTIFYQTEVPPKSAVLFKMMTILPTIALICPIIIVGAISESIWSWVTSSVERSRVKLVEKVEHCFIRYRSLRGARPGLT